MQPVQVRLNLAGRQMNMWFDQDSIVHRNILSELHAGGTYERPTQMFLMRVMRAGDAFVDVGAHIGYFSLLAAALVGETGRVVAVEPIAENYAQLSRHIAENDLSWVTPVNAVIADADGERAIFFNADNDGGHALWDPAKHPANELTRQNPRADSVASLRLGTLLAENDVDRVRLMKIDTEGAEASILDAARDVFDAGRVDFIIMEVNLTGLQNMGTDIDGLFELARELGFVVCLLQADGSAPVLLARDNRPDPRYVYNVLLASPAALAGL
jgi:FkbM family methyltransferase